MMNTTDQYITTQVLNQRGQPTGSVQQVANPNYNPQTDPQAVAIAQQTPAVLSNTPNNAGALTAPQQAPAQAVPQSNPILSRVSPALAMPQRPTAPTAPTYGGSLGMAMMAGSQAAAAQGGNAMFAGMADGYNKGKQAEYNANLNTYKAEQKQYEDGLARYNTSVAKQAEKRKAFQTTITPLYNQVEKLRNAKARLYKNPNEIKNSITGFFETSRYTDLLSNDPAAAEREVTRKILNDLGVDYTLLKTARTKGAISDREMEMFASGTMSMNNSEQQWSQWIDGQIEAMALVIKNMEEIESGVRQPYSQENWGNVDSLIGGGSSQTTPKPAAPPTDAPTIQGKHGAYKQVTPQ